MRRGRTARGRLRTGLLVRQVLPQQQGPVRVRVPWPLPPARRVQARAGQTEQAPCPRHQPVAHAPQRGRSRPLRSLSSWHRRREPQAAPGALALRRPCWMRAVRAVPVRVLVRVPPARAQALGCAARRRHLPPSAERGAARADAAVLVPVPPLARHLTTRAPEPHRVAVAPQAGRAPAAPAATQPLGPARHAARRARVGPATAR